MHDSILSTQYIRSTFTFHNFCNKIYNVVPNNFQLDFIKQPQINPQLDFRKQPQINPQLDFRKQPQINPVCVACKLVGDIMHRKCFQHIIQLEINIHIPKREC
jgi:hypothetical protein